MVYWVSVFAVWGFYLYRNGYFYESEYSDYFEHYDAVDLFVGAVAWPIILLGLLYCSGNDKRRSE
jgi:hypothetical protein